MGRQVNFFALDEDVDLLERRLRESADIAVIGDRSPSPKPRRYPSARVVEDGEEVLFLHLARTQDLSRLVLDHVPQQGHWVVDVITSPVVELTRCFFDGKLLRRGRFYYVPGYWHQDGTWIDKPAEFQSWAKSVLTTTKKAFARHDGNYIGPSASTWLTTTGGKLVEM